MLFSEKFPQIRSDNGLKKNIALYSDLNPLPDDFWQMGREWSMVANKIVYKNYDSKNIEAPF